MAKRNKEASAEFARQKSEAEKFLSDRGRELPDPTPLAPPVGYKKAPSMADIIRQQIRSERLAQEAAAGGFETFDEADDFEIPDDPIDPGSPYEEMFDPEPRQAPYRTAQEELDDRRSHRKPPAPPETRTKPDPASVKGREAPREALDGPGTE